MAECAHWWVIEVAAGEWSKGWCKHCGEEKRFRNVIPDDYDMHWRNLAGRPVSPNVDEEETY